MKKLLFIASHLGSGYEKLGAILNENNRIMMYSTGMVYSHPENVRILYDFGHKLDNSAAIYGDYILFNPNLSHSSYYDFAKFIYVISSAEYTLNKLIEDDYDELRACRYYCFRLRRIYEMARRTPGAVLLTRDNLQDQKGADLIEDYLELPDKLDFSSLFINAPNSNVIKPSLVEEAQNTYEKYLYNMRQLDLRLIR